MGKSKELSFEPSRGLAIVTGLLEGLTERKKSMEAAEATAAKQQNALIPHLLRQMQFQQTERREGEEFRADIGLRQSEAERKQNIFQQEFGLKIKQFDFKKESERLQRDFDLRLEGIEQTGQLTRDSINNLFKEKLLEMTNTAERIRQDDQQLFLEQQQTRQQDFLGRESGKGRTFTTAEREAGQTFTEIENQLDRDLQRDLRGKTFEGEEQVVLTNYQNAAKEYKDIINLLANPVNLKNEFLNKQAVVAADEMARWGNQLTPIYESKGLAPPLIPPTIQPFEDRGRGIFNFGRDQQFGFVPRLEIPTADVEAIDKPVEAIETQPSKAVSKVEEAKAATLQTTGAEFDQFVSSLKAQMKQQKKSSIKLDDRSRRILLERGFDPDAIERAASSR